MGKVRLNDPDVDAKLFPHLLPHGTGSVYASYGDGGIITHVRQRLLDADPAFRWDSVYIFWMLDRHIKNELFHAMENDFSCHGYKSIQGLGTTVRQTYV